MDSADDLNEVVNDGGENNNGDEHGHVFNLRHDYIENFRKAPGYPIE